MEPILYAFGICKGEKLFFLVDPIRIVNGMVDELEPWRLGSLFEKRKLKLNMLIEEFDMRRGIIFFVSKTSNKITKFLKYCKLLSPNISEKYFCIYFLNDEKIVLFKVNKLLKTPKKIRNQIWEVIEALKLLSKKKFKQLAKEGESYSKFHPYGLCFETKKLKLSAAKPYHLFMCIKAKNYSQLKKKIKRIYKGGK